MNRRRTPPKVVQSRWEARWNAIRESPRVVALGLLVVGLFWIFGHRLWKIQFVEGEHYRRLSERQSTREVTISAPRGIIYDRTGLSLVRNVPGFNVVVVPAYLPDDEDDGEGETFEIASDRAEEVLIRLAMMLDMPYTTVGTNTGADNPPLGVRDILRNTLRDQNGNEVPFSTYYRPVVIKRGVDRDTALLVAQQALLLPGVSVEVESRREYPYGPLVSQILGYLLPVPQEAEEEYVARGYDPDTDRVGMAGVEATYEEALRGKKGRQIVEEDVLGRVIRVVAELEPFVPGDNVYLTLDLDLQRSVEEALRQGMERADSPRGVAIVMNPQTGEILALVSLPTYDNNVFTRGLSAGDLQSFQDPHRPLMNHAISDRLQPGSVFKIVTAAGALQEGVLNGRSTRLNCSGKIVVPNRYAPNDPGLATTFNCWNRAGHGWLDVVGGIAHSCNVFFYKVGGGFEDEIDGLGPEQLAHYATLFGFGELTGVELTGESEGRVPTPRWKRRTYGESWSTGNTYHLSIGEGFLEVTPLQMLNAVNAVANGGTLYRPHIVHHVTDAQGNVTRPFEPQVIRTLPIDAENWSLIQQGMEGAVEYGTSQRVQIEGLRIWGKTGTAQFCDDIARAAGDCEGSWPEHAWFAAYAAREGTTEAEVSTIVFLYHGGEGSTMAVPVARDILTAYFGLVEEEGGVADEDDETTP